MRHFNTMPRCRSGVGLPLYCVLYWRTFVPMVTTNHCNFIAKVLAQVASFVIKLLFLFPGVSSDLDYIIDTLYIRFCCWPHGM